MNRGKLFRHRERSVAILDCRTALAMTSPGLLPDRKVHGERSVAIGTAAAFGFAVTTEGNP